MTATMEPCAARLHARLLPSRVRVPIAQSWTPRSVWLGGFVALIATFLLQNIYLFHVRVYEDADAAANSILVGQAKHFSLLVGNYSRMGFNHPGPADMYVQAAGEWVFHDVLHLVPTPWNGQMLAILILNASLLAAVLAVLHSWSRESRVVILAGGALLALVVAEPILTDSAWMPWVYCAPFLLLLVSAASVAAGRVESCAPFTVAAGLLVHGHACFLFFVPVIGILTLVLFLRGKPAESIRGLVRQHRRSLLTSAVVAAVFVFPILLNLALNWPGEFGKYIAYGRQPRGPQPVFSAVRYALAYWGLGSVGYALFPLTTVVAVISARRLPHSRLRSACLSLVGMTSATTVLVTYYAWHGIDDLSEPYMAYFALMAPIALAMTTVASLATRETIVIAAPAGRFRALIAFLVAGAMVLAAIVPLSGRTDAVGSGRYTGDPALPHALTEVTDVAGGRPIVISIVDHDAWPDAVALLVATSRAGLDSCVSEPEWAFMVTGRSVCTSAERTRGIEVDVRLPARVPSGASPLASLTFAVITVGD